MINAKDIDLSALNLEQQTRVTHALEQYLKWLELGETPDFDRLLALYPDVAETLKRYMPQHLLADKHKPKAIAVEPKREKAPKPSADRSAEEPPKCLGDHELMEEIGRGGMGIVFKAKQTSLDRIVALKILPNAATWDSKQIARFKNEAQAAAQLNHPNIVSVFSVGQENGTYYYSMPLIDGLSLEKAVRIFESEPSFDLNGEGTAQRMAGNDPRVDRRNRNRASLATILFGNPGQLTKKNSKPIQGEAKGGTTINESIASSDYVCAVVELVAQAADALHFAHQRGIIHRDIKPSNLLIDRKGNLWITDFGLAMISGSSGLTGTGDVMGTLKYMSPEQATGRSHWIDHRSDIYSLGITMYELLTLKPAVNGEDRMAMLKQIKNQSPPSVRKQNPAVSKTLENVLLQAISKYPEERYATAELFAQDLRRYLASGRSLANRPGVVSAICRVVRHNPQWSLIASAVPLLLILVLLPMLHWYSSRNANLEERVAQANQQLQNASATVRALGSPMLHEMRLSPETESIRRQISQELARFLDAFSEHAQKDPEFHSQLGQLKLEIARLHEWTGTQKDAIHEYRLCKDQIAKWVAEGAIHASPIDLFVVHHDLARLRISQGLLEPAVQDLRPFLDSVGKGKFLTHHPEAFAFPRFESLLRLDLGLALSLQNARVAADKELVRAYTLLQDKTEPVVAMPSERWLNQSIVSALLQNANLETVNPELSHRLIQRALSIANADRNNKNNSGLEEQQLAQCFLALGLNSIRLGQHQDCSQWFRRATRITDYLVKKEPGNHSIRYEHATALNSLGHAEFSAGKIQEAQDSFQNAVKALEATLAIQDNPIYRHRLGETLCDLAAIAVANKEFELARSLLRRAIDEQMAAVKQLPDNKQLQLGLEQSQKMQAQLPAAR